MTSVSEESFEKALDKIRELSREKRDLVEALEGVTRWVGKGIADGAFDDCVNPARAKDDLTRAEDAIQKAKA